MVIAHRGFAGQFPENTVRSVRGAAAADAAMVEIDVQPTADGDVVAFHDRRLDDGGESRGVTDERGVVWERSTATVTSARVLGTEERVPLLSEVFEALPPAVGVNVELKNPGSDAIRPGEALGEPAREAARRRWQSFVTSVLAVADRFEHDVLYSSFCEGALAAVDSVAPGESLAVLVEPGGADAGATVARRYDVDAINHPLAVLRADATLPASLQTAADAVDASRYVWTVTDWRAADRALASGADGIIADYAGLTAYRDD
ncbi:glycerophosphodiester phosphodiesterase [Haloarcula marina]|uniref:glycerophosphodiester phosphodiesterase n=1 Tax=Haloarcula marina TaxID=2961574 RepID=UPI0020B8719B|nr:glycerophosphodiester phosphodiesterase [Halomicroarcula marina]